MPVIGISCYVEPTTRGEWVDQVSAVLPVGYIRQVERAGGLAVLLPPPADSSGSMDDVAGQVLDRVDGLVLAGGADVGSAAYGAQPHDRAQPARADRDAWELALARVSAARDLPTLGVCRGMQVMAVAAGGTLEQHVPDRVGHHEHSPGRGAYARHHVRTVPGSRMSSIVGADPAEVPTYHHQSVLTHPGFEPSAWHDDGTLEAMEDLSGLFRVAVQWHPEAGDDGRLFDALVSAARSRLAAAP